MKQTLNERQKGDELPPARFELTRDWVDAYVNAVGDDAIANLGSDAVPPMAVAALSVRALIESSPLPPGTLHASQELAFHRPVRVGEEIAAGAKVISRGERAGWVLMNIELDVRAAGERAMTGRAMITFPAEAAV
jgi:acyl dehydratase